MAAGAAQGLVLDASELQWEELDRMGDTAQLTAAGGPPPVWLALDEVQDPVRTPPTPP